MPEKNPKCIIHNYRWESGKNGIIIHKCGNCGEEVAVVKVQDYIKFDVRTSKETPHDPRI